jgi:hypothetical protein
MAMIDGTVSMPPSNAYRRLHPIVFISGSTSIDKLPASAIKKIDTIIRKNFTILVGDANGVDLQVQKYLSTKKYDNVVVYCAGPTIKNNVGKWKVKKITGDNNKNEKDLCILKDSAMTNDTDYGLMIWDGLSIETLNNIKEMKNRNKRFYVVLDGTALDENNIDIIINMQINR